MPLDKIKINSLEVKAAPKYGGMDNKPPRGSKLFSEPFANIYLSAKKKSGKTSNIFFILQRILGPETKLIIFCSTVHKDASWIFMVKYFKMKGIDVETHTSLKEEGVDLLQELVHDLENEQEESDEEDEEPDPKEVLKQKGEGIIAAVLKHNLPVLQGDGDKVKKRKSRYLERKYVIVLDDLSTELKTKSLVGLLKKNRHFQSSILVSSQYLNDLDPQSRKQIDYWLIYKGATEEKLETIYKDADISIPFEEFKEIYQDATEEPYNFLYVDVRNDQFRKNYNEKYNV
jgi:hypothetical protein